MKERPIIFSAPMIRAILGGRKTMTRRMVKKNQPVIECPYGKPGDRLWVRETWAPCISCPCDPGNIIYRADACQSYDKLTWKSPIYMPRFASRITMEITNIRVERLQDISEADVLKEGVFTMLDDQGRHNPQKSFRILLESINGSGSWADNPWAWVIEFRKL